MNFVEIGRGIVRAASHQVSLDGIEERNLTKEFLGVSLNSQLSPLLGKEEDILEKLERINTPKLQR